MSQMMSFGKGFVAGAMVSVGVLMLMDPKASKQCRKIKKRANAVAGKMGNMIEDMFE